MSVDIFKDIRNKSDEEIKQFILTKYGDPNFQTLGYTLLHSAAQVAGNANVIRVLVSMRADLTAKDFTGFTPIHLAVLDGIVDAVVALLLYPFDIDTPCKSGLTPLFYATGSKERAGDNSVKVAKLLIDNGADISNPDVRFMLLTNAKKVGDSAMVDYLSGVFADKEKALAEQNKEEHNDTIDNNINSANHHYQQGKEYQEKGLYSQAFDEFSKCLSIEPNHADASYSRGMVRLFLSEIKESIDDITRAIKLIHPLEKWQYFAARGTAHYFSWKMNNTIKTDNALADLIKVLALNPPESVLADAKRMLGEIEDEKRKEEKKQVDKEKQAERDKMKMQRAEWIKAGLCGYCGGKKKSNIEWPFLFWPDVHCFTQTCKSCKELHIYSGHRDSFLFNKRIFIFSYLILSLILISCLSVLLDGEVLNWLLLCCVPINLYMMLTKPDNRWDGCFMVFLSLISWGYMIFVVIYTLSVTPPIWYIVTAIIFAYIFIISGMLRHYEGYINDIYKEYEKLE